ncbi:hypothetical protein [Caballeronia sp. TF1N1]|uniref:hypothetical protein n=1 Tax=Caballeronia sp. TF1N1 TaxID=2878153 RepID=UPI001FD5C3D5|nr:hypothetical protein [Caballeronia sp. TF1N1]
MTMRDLMKKAFAEPARTATSSWDRALRSKEEKNRAGKEKKLQLDKFDRLVKTHYSRMVDRERQKVSLQQPKPVLQPTGTRRQLTPKEIEDLAQANVKSRIAAARKKIEKKSVSKFLADADNREKSERQHPERVREMPTAKHDAERPSNREQLAKTDNEPRNKEETQPKQAEQATMSEADILSQIAALERTPVKPVQTDHLALEDTAESAATRQAEIDALWAAMDAREHEDMDNDNDLGHER